MSVAPKQFGKDHWSLLAYAETCVVEGQPLDKRRLRCNGKRHPFHDVNGSICKWQPSYGTRLHGYFAEKDPLLQLPEHDDWDCLDDLEDAGYIEVMSEAIAAVKFTELGLKVCSEVRAHKANGGNFSSFVLDDQAVKQA